MIAILFTLLQFDAKQFTLEGALMRDKSCLTTKLCVTFYTFAVVIVVTNMRCVYFYAVFDYAFSKCGLFSANLNYHIHISKVISWGTLIFWIKNLFRFSIFTNNFVEYKLLPLRKVPFWTVSFAKMKVDIAGWK